MTGAGVNGEALIPESSYFVSLLNGASIAAADLGYSLVLAPPGASDDAIARLHVDGMIVVDPVGQESGLTSGAVPVVATGRPPRSAPSAIWVDNDHREAAWSALNHLCAQGYRYPALITRPGRQSYLVDAAAAYRSWCREHRVEPVIVRVPGPLSEDHTAEAVARLLRSRPDVDGVYATLDRLAIGALMGAEGAGHEVGGTVGIAALPDSPLLLAARPQITAIDLRPEEIGRQAARLLVRLVGGEAAETSVMVGTELRQRSSTGPARK
ncbi:LacI family DNA-binding transcriptional regulator [Streptomyces sp. Lzd4kr]|nr:LacI family DNA-binding transcriptional regulator [Streptomyces sp. Lzd4kr]